MAKMDDITVGIIGMGEMGKMYARRISAAGWKEAFEGLSVLLIRCSIADNGKLSSSFFTCTASLMT